MTTFTGPVNIVALDSETTAISLAATGAATFNGAVGVSGATTLTGTVSAGPANAEGRMVHIQAVTVAGNTSGASNIRLPSGSQISDVWMTVTATASNNTQGIIVRIGTSGDATFFGQLKGSARNVYRAPIAPNATNASVAAYRIGASNVQIHLDVTAASSAGETDLFEAVLFIQYVR